MACSDFWHREHGDHGLPSRRRRGFQETKSQFILSVANRCPDVLGQTKKKRSSRRKPEDSGIDSPPVGEDAMHVDQGAHPSRMRDLDANFVDDDELQAALARARREKLTKKPKIATQEEIARKRT